MKYTKADVSEVELEDLVRRDAGQIEEGLIFVDHQKNAAGGRLDVLLVDSGKSLVVAELKVTEDDSMLLQALDYYDYVSTQVESFGRLYNKHGVDPTQQVRLFLIAPSFSQTLVNRCKWLDLPISLFTFNCLKVEGQADLVPIFTEQQITAPREIVEVTTLEDHLNYITDPKVRAKAKSLLDKIKEFKPGNISLDPIKYTISIKINGRVFAHLTTRRHFYVITTFDAHAEWKDFPIKGDDDLTTVKPIIKAAMERMMK